MCCMSCPTTFACKERLLSPTADRIQCTTNSTGRVPSDVLIGFDVARVRASSLRGWRVHGASLVSTSPAISIAVTGSIGIISSFDVAIDASNVAPYLETHLYSLCNLACGCIDYVLVTPNNPRLCQSSRQAMKDS